MRRPKPNAATAWGNQAKRFLLPALRSPQLVQARVSSTAAGVELVAQWILLVEILMIRLGRPELRRRYNRRHDGLLERLVLLPVGARSFRQALLLRVVIEDRWAVLRANVAELAVLYGRVVVEPEGCQQRLVAHLPRVVR